MFKKGIDEGKQKYWEVVGGGANKGIVVRKKADMSSQALEDRLGTGAVVQEIKIVGERLHYQLVSGTGPEFGWVSLSLKGKPLVQKIEKMQFSELTPLPDKDMYLVPLRWRDAASKGIPTFVRELDLSLAESLAEDGVISQRLPILIQEMFVLLKELIAGESPNVEAGGVLVFMLFQISCSLNLHEVRVKRGPAPTAPCALILGFGGSSLDDLKLQSEFYQSKGFTTIASSLLGRPVALRHKQCQQIAAELSSALASGGRLVIHMCSNNGLYFGMSVIGNWIAKQVPFNRLPPLEEVLSALVFDCAPSFPTDLATGEIIVPQPAQEGTPPESTENVTPPDSVSKEEAENKKPSEAELAVINSEVDFYVKVLMGTVGGLTAHLATQFDKGTNPSLLTTVQKSPLAMECVRAAAAACALGKAEYNDSAFDDRSRPFSVWDFEKWDLTLAKPLPRLFLYADQDYLVTQEKVEAYARHVSRYNPKANIITGKIGKSQHCMCWVTDYKNSAKLAEELIRSADMTAKPMAAAHMGA